MQFIWGKKLADIRAKHSATVVPFQEVSQEAVISTYTPEPEPVVAEIPQEVVVPEPVLEVLQIVVPEPEVILVAEASQPEVLPIPEPVVEVPQEAVAPADETDKILVTEHKDGECLASSCKEDDAFGGRKEEVNGQEVVLPCAEVGEGVVQEGSA